MKAGHPVEEEKVTEVGGDSTKEEEGGCLGGSHADHSRCNLSRTSTCYTQRLLHRHRNRHRLHTSNCWHILQLVERLSLEVAAMAKAVVAVAVMSGVAMRPETTETAIFRAPPSLLQRTLDPLESERRWYLMWLSTNGQCAEHR